MILSVLTTRFPAKSSTTYNARPVQSNVPRTPGSRKGLAALLSITRQLLQLLAISNSRGFILRNITPENRVLKGPGEVLTGLSPLPEEGSIYCEPEEAEAVTEAPTRTARSFLHDAHQNGL